MKVTKMHGLGNDFILFDSLIPDNYDLRKLAVKLCNRYTGIGADGLLLVLSSTIADIQMRIINSDGTEPAMCGNGIRCFSKYVFEHNIIAETNFTVETLAGIMKPEIILNNHNKVEAIRVNMGSPSLAREDIPMIGKAGKVINEQLSIENETFQITSMLMNIPHTIVFVDDLDPIDIETTGRRIEHHAAFPVGTNVNFVQIQSAKEIKVRTWERAIGSSLACGTGSCASVVAAVLNNKTENKLTVNLPLGQLEIEWADDVYMTGPAEAVFESNINLD